MRSRRALVAVIAIIALTAVFVAFIAAAPPIGYDGEPELVANPVDHVDTLIGTGTGGETVGEINNFPGASVPFGMVQYSPDTFGNYAGYNYDNPRSTGFSMTHASVSSWAILSQAFHGCEPIGVVVGSIVMSPNAAQPTEAWVMLNPVERGLS